MLDVRPVGIFGMLEQTTENQRSRKRLKVLVSQFTPPPRYLPKFSPSQVFTFPFLSCSVMVWFHILQRNGWLPRCLGRRSVDFFSEITKNWWRSVKCWEQMLSLLFLVCKHTSLTAGLSVINLVNFLNVFTSPFLYWTFCLLEKIIGSWNFHYKYIWKMKWLLVSEVRNSLNITLIHSWLEIDKEIAGLFNITCKQYAKHRSPP